MAFATSLQRFPIQEVTLKVMRAAFGICERYHLSFWDSAIVAAARALGCGTLYTEDLSAGQDYEGVRVANPFD
jgi:predicted nucleic acid-binding protein